MTIGIGLVCCSGKAILLGADMRASYGTATSNDQTAKLFELPANYCGAVAGRLSQCTDVISWLYHEMKKCPTGEIAPGIVQAALQKSYLEVFKELAKEELWNRHKITMDRYLHDKRLVSTLRSAAEETIKSVKINVHLIVGGFFEGQPVQFVVQGGITLSIRSEVNPGNAAIGSGQAAAMNWLNYRRQNITVGLARSLFHLTEAKQFAEVEQTVGPQRQMLLLRSGRFDKLEGDEGQNLTQKWWNKYGLPLSDGVDRPENNNAVLDAFKLPDFPSET